jgi:hypothetical protein
MFLYKKAPALEIPARPTKICWLLDATAPRLPLKSEADMATSPYKTLAPAGVQGAKEFLKQTPLTVGNTRSDEYPPTKTSGVKIRGTGAATKGTTARGPMA